MRIAGRGEDGLAKALNMNNSGQVKVATNENNYFERLLVPENSTHELISGLPIDDFNSFSLSLVPLFNDITWTYGFVKIRVVTSTQRTDYTTPYKIFDKTYNLDDFVTGESIEGENPSYLLQDTLIGKFVKVEIINTYETRNITFGGLHFRLQKYDTQRTDKSKVIARNRGLVLHENSTETLFENLDTRNTSAFSLSIAPRFDLSAWENGRAKVRITGTVREGDYTAYSTVHDKVYTLDDFTKNENESTVTDFSETYVLRDNIQGSFMRVQLINEMVGHSRLTFGVISIEDIQGGITDENIKKGVDFTGVLTGVDNENNVHGLSVEVDENDKAALRVVDAAPFAYDSIANRYHVESVSKGTVIDEVINQEVDEQYVNANDSQTFNVDFTNESEIWFMVEFTQTEWSLKSGTALDQTVPSNEHTFFPPLNNENGNQAISLFLPTAPSTDFGVTAPSTLSEAKQYPTSPSNETYTFEFKNESSGPGVLKIRVLRVYN